MHTSSLRSARRAVVGLRALAAGVLLNVFLGADPSYSQEIACDVFVNKGAGGDGSSWNTAFSELHEALESIGKPQSTVNVCVAAGEYAPATRDAHDSFELRNHVSLYGGFSGNESMPFDLRSRRLAGNKTVLSGHGVNDSVLRCSAGDCNKALQIDGFTVTGGIGGMSGGPTLNGGGLFNAIGALTLSNMVFVENQAMGQGGAIFNVGGNLTLSNVVIHRNRAGREGGGMYSHSGKLTVSNGVFIENESRYAGGGGLYTLGKTEVSNSVFVSNTAAYGAVVVAAHWFTLTNSIAWANTSGEGSQIFVNPGLATVAYSIIEDAGTANNTAYAGIANTDADPLFTNTADPDGPDDTWGTADDGLILRAASPAIDAGTKEGVSLPDRDLLGKPRIHGTSVDTGPYEFDPAGTTTAREEESPRYPESFILAQNYPNPFNPATQIAFTLPASGHVRLAVYDLLGHEVRLLLDKTMAAGTHEVSFDASRLPSGVYTCVMRSGSRILQRKMVLSR